MIRITLILVFAFVSGCAVRQPDGNVRGYICPDSCGDAWLCEGDPICDDDNYRFLCEKWE